MSNPTRPSVPRGDTEWHQVDGGALEEWMWVHWSLFGPCIFKVSILYWQMQATQCPLPQQVRGNSRNRNPNLIKASSQTVAQGGNASSVHSSHKSLLVAFYAGLCHLSCNKPTSTLPNFLLLLLCLHPSSACTGSCLFLWCWELNWASW